MLKRCNSFLMIACLCLYVTCTSGCTLLVGAAVGGGSVAYVKGVLEKNFDKPVKDVYKASVSGLKALDYFVTQEELDRHSAKVVAEDDTGKTIQVGIEALTERSSKIKIRVGMFGDQDKAQMILNSIQKKL